MNVELHAGRNFSAEAAPPLLPPTRTLMEGFRPERVRTAGH